MDVQAGERGEVIECDIVVAGGSTAALAAAIAAVDESQHALDDPSGGSGSSVEICLTEPTDWVGGQVSSNT